MEYQFQDGDTKKPVSYLDELQRQRVSSTPAPPTISKRNVTTTASPSAIIDSAVINTKIVFNTSSPIPIESLVLSVVRSLLGSRLSNLTDSVKVLDVTYEKISDTSYAVIFTFNLSNIIMPNNTDIRNATYNQVKSSINNAINTLLNNPSAKPIEPHSSNLIITANQVKGKMEYQFQDGDTRKPVSYLDELQRQRVSSTKAPPTISKRNVTTTASPSAIIDSAVVNTKLVFNTSSPIPIESLVLSVVRSLLDSRLSNLTDSVKVLDVTYEKISDTSYAVIFTFSLSNIIMPNNTDFRNATYNQVKSSVNNALNTLLNEPSTELLQPQSLNFISSPNQVKGNMEYKFHYGDKIPVSFLNELRLQSGMRTTTPSTANTPLQSTTAPTIFGNILIYIRVVFKNLLIIPSETQVVAAAKALLNTSVRAKRDFRIQKLNNPVSIQNVTYQKMDNSSYIISFGFKISNVSMIMTTEQRNYTYNLIENTINDLMNKILNTPGAVPFVFPRANYTENTTVIVATAEYVYGRDDIKSPSGFLAQILQYSGLASTTTSATITTAAHTTMHFLTVFNTINPSNSTSTGGSWWILGIIIPCSIAVIIIPCLILVCCLLCGCCAALRRRYHRRRSYNIQYTTRNGLF